MKLTPELLLVRSEILDQLYLYCRGVDRRDWQLVRQCYHPGAVDDHGGDSRTIDQFIGWLETRHRSIAQSFHTLMNVSFTHRSDTCVHTEAYAIARQAIDKKPDARLAVGCRYLDQFELRDDEWRIVHRQVIYEWIEVVPVSADLLGRSSKSFARRDPSDPSFGHLMDLRS